MITKEEQIDKILSSEEGMRELAKSCAFYYYKKYGEVRGKIEEQIIYNLLKTQNILEETIKSIK